MQRPELRGREMKCKCLERSARSVCKLTLWRAIRVTDGLRLSFCETLFPDEKEKLLQSKIENNETANRSLFRWSSLIKGHSDNINLWLIFSKSDINLKGVQVRITPRKRI